MVSELEFVVVDTDKKSSYPGQLREAFGRERLLHSRTSSREPRTVANPLFPINQTEAIGRDLLGRLAPGLFVQLGLLGLLYTFRHPAAGETPSSHV
jgi:hypothetical protein